MQMVIYDKTVKGREEISSRSYQLAPRMRSLLVMVDGKQTAEALLGKVAGLGLDAESIATLLKDGFIAVVQSASAPVPPPAPTKPAASVAAKPVEPVRAPAPAAPAPAPARAPAPPAAPALPPVVFKTTTSTPAPAAPPAIQQQVFASAATQFQAAYGFFTRSIKPTLGIRGLPLQLKVEKAGTVEELRALRYTFLELAAKSKGEAVAETLRNELDSIFGPG